MKRIGILLLSCAFSLQAKKDLITDIIVSKNTLKIIVHEEFKRTYLTDDFFVEYEPDIVLDQFDYSVLSMPFLLNVISLVWISGKTYHIDEMDAELHESLERIKKVFKMMYPKTSWNGELKVGKLVPHHRPFTDDPTKTALLFTGGVDSVSSALAHRDKQQLLITAWGHWDLPLTNKHLFNERFQKIQSFAASFGNTATSLRSNYTSILKYEYLAQLSPEIPKWRLFAVEGLGWAGLIAPILLAKGYSTLRIASSHTWQYPYPSAASPFIDNNLRLCGLKLLHDQFNFTRLQKIAYIDSVYQELGMKKPFLKICSYEKREDRNCHGCRKCFTTILCFIACGINPEPYGLHYNKDIAANILDSFREPQLNYYTILLAQEMQETLRKRLSNGNTLDPFLTKFLAIDFARAYPFDIAAQTKLHWPDLIALLPQDHALDIPEALR